MHMAAKGGRLDVIKYLLPTFGARVLEKTNNSYTMLHWAAQNGHCQVARYLIELLNMDLQDRDKVCVCGGWVPREGKTCSKVGMGFSCLCVVIIEVMFSEQPFYLVVTDEQNKVCTQVHVVFEKSINSLLHYSLFVNVQTELIKYFLHRK